MPDTPVEPSPADPYHPALDFRVSRPESDVHDTWATMLRIEVIVTEIKATLDDQGFNRGLSFDREMLPYCGQTLRVKRRVDRLIDETTGRMLKIPKDCIILDGPVCSGECSTGRWFCPREIYPYWREAWLRRVDEPADALGADDIQLSVVRSTGAS